jgi:hypothetical protein
VLLYVQFVVSGKRVILFCFEFLSLSRQRLSHENAATLECYMQLITNLVELELPDKIFSCKKGKVKRMAIYAVDVL